MRRGVVPIVVASTVLLIAAAAAADPLQGPVITAAANPGDQFTPAVAWADEFGRGLVVWEQDVSGVRQIVGRTVDADGTPLGNSFPISDAATDQTDPDVVYDPGNDRYLVVWVSEFSASDTDLAGRFIPWIGVDDTLQPFGIEGATSLQLAPAVEYAPPPIDEYLVVWQNVEGFDPATIRARRLAPDTGSSITPSSFPLVGDATFSRWNPRLAWNAEAARYLVVYERFQGSAEEDVYGAEVSFSGTVFTSDLGIAGFPAEENQVDVAACEGSWMVVWTGGQGISAQVYARPVAGDLSLGSISNLSAPSVDHRWPAVACNPHGQEFLVTWEDVFSTLVTGVVGGFLDADGSLVESFNVAAPGVGDVIERTRPAVVIQGQTPRAYVVWELDRADLLHQDLAGRWVDMSLFSDGFEFAGTGRWSDAVGTE